MDVINAKLISVDKAIDSLCAGDSLSEESARSLFAQIVGGEMDEVPLAGLLVALKGKGEDVSELVGAARALRDAALPFPAPEGLFADTCGTGGDGSNTLNISTAVAFTAAACGLPVVKHGNRSITSRCGSADVLERLGARLDLSPEASRALLDEVGVCFLFAPHYHPGMRHAGPVRKALGVRTIFNMLGPCLNPAAPPVQIVGVPTPAMVEPIARTLQALGCDRALVVHGSGLDEIALHGPTTAMQLTEDTLAPLEITPELAEVERAPVQSLAGGDPDENAARLRELLGGKGGQAPRDMVAINAGALLMLAGLAPTLAKGTRAALDALAAGTPGERLQAFVEASRG
jgi:anthranilate phosphoribosyltransferase